MNLIGSGAEANIYSDENKVIKKRVSKSYRLKELDEAIRKKRTRTESKIIQTLQKTSVCVPKFINSDNTQVVEMELINGQKLRDILNKNISLSLEIGKNVAILHKNGIIHGDLTTSNMILNRENNICFIDFGLSFFSKKIEDKAVDIHLFKQALESKHHTVSDACFKLFLQGYKQGCKEVESKSIKMKNNHNSADYDHIMQRFEEVEQRGRYKHK